MIINDVIHLVHSPFIIVRSDGAVLFDTARKWSGDMSPDIAVLEIKHIRSVCLPNCPVDTVVVFDV